MRHCPPTSPVCRTARDIVLALLVFLAVFALALADPRAAFSASSLASAKTAATQPTALESARSGTLLLRSRDGEVQPSALDLGTDVEITVNGPIARAQVTQRFRNTGKDWVEGVYVFPLPEEASVDSLRMEIGERVIEGRIASRDEARAVYEQAKARGTKTSLIEQQRPNVFTSAVANIGPGEMVTVRIEYQETVRREGGVFSLRFPLVVAPRYDGGSPANVRTVRYVPGKDTGDKIAPPVLPPEAGKANPVSLQVSLDPGFELGDITSHHHDVAIERTEDGRAILALAEGTVPADKDFELSWSPKAQAAPQVALYREAVGGSEYVLAMVTPPAPDEVATLPARELVFVIDTSGSMSGASIGQAQASLLFALDRLKPGDRFNIVRFSGETETLFEAPVDASSENLAIARHFTRRLTASGGTEMIPALQKALADPTPQDTRLRQIVLLTDGAIRQEAQAFTTIAGKRGRSRLFLVGIGSAPNSYFMRRAAEVGRGTFTHIGSADQVQDRMRDLFVKLERPAITNLRAEWAPGVRVEAWPAPLPDLYAGEPVVVAAQLSSLKGDMTLSGTLNGKPWSQPVKLAGARDGAGVGKLWARRKIAALEARHWSGQDPATITDAIRTVALEHHLVSSETSLVAVDTSTARPDGTPLQTVDVPVNLPAGWEYDAVFERGKAHSGSARNFAPAPARLAAAPSQSPRDREAAPTQDAALSKLAQARTGTAPPAQTNQTSMVPAGGMAPWFSNRLLIVAVMALFFAAMVAVTLGFWRHLGREYVSTRRNGRGT